jgi:hypothetical protein
MVANPVPRTIHPDWLSKMVREKNDPLKQQNLKDMFGKITKKNGLAGGNEQPGQQLVEVVHDMEDMFGGNAAVGGKGIPVVHRRKRVARPNPGMLGYDEGGHEILVEGEATATAMELALENDPFNKNRKKKAAAAAAAAKPKTAEERAKAKRQEIREKKRDRKVAKMMAQILDKADAAEQSSSSEEDESDEDLDALIRQGKASRGWQPGGLTDKVLDGWKGKWRKQRLARKRLNKEMARMARNGDIVGANRRLQLTKEATRGRGLTGMFKKAEAAMYTDHWQIIEVRPAGHSSEQKAAAAAAASGASGAGGREEKVMDSDLGGTGSAAAAGGAGEYTVFAMVGKGTLRRIAVKAPRTVFLNCRGGEDANDLAEWNARPVDRFLPHGRSAGHLYEMTLKESTFLRNPKELSDLLTHPDIEGVYERHTPLDFDLTVRLGCVSRVARGSEPFRPTDLKMLTTTTHAYLEPNSAVYRRIYLYHSFASTGGAAGTAKSGLSSAPSASQASQSTQGARSQQVRGVVGMFVVKESNADIAEARRQSVGGQAVGLEATAYIFVADPNPSPGSRVRMKNIFKRYADGNPNVPAGYKCEFVTKVVKTMEQAFAGVARKMEEYRAKNNGPTVVVPQSFANLAELVRVIPALDELPVVQSKPNMDDHMYPLLGWQDWACKRMIQRYLRFDMWWEERIHGARYAQIPVGSIGEDFACAMADVFFARLLRENKMLLWCSRTFMPDLGGAEAMAFAGPNSMIMEHSNPTTCAPGAYRSVCVDLDIHSLAVNTLLNAALIFDIEGGDQSLLEDDYHTGNQQGGGNGGGNGNDGGSGGGGQGGGDDGGDGGYFGGSQAAGGDGAAGEAGGRNGGGGAEDMDDAPLDRAVGSASTLNSESSTSCSSAFKVLRAMVNNWFYDVQHTNNVYADALLIHFYRWLCSPAGLSFDPALHRMVHGLMEKVRLRLASVSVTILECSTYQSVCQCTAPPLSPLSPPPRSDTVYQPLF